MRVALIYKFRFRTIIFFTIFFMLNIISNCQTVIEGEVQSIENETLPGISILVYSDVNSTTIITYAITDEKGKFKLEFTTGSDSVYISTKSLSFKDTLIAVANKVQKIEILLPSQIHEIREVSVKGYPISVRGDTLNYIVNSFAKAKDQSIGDVISHMPGFEVTELGQIYYQGKPIQKYYIEGLDLLENRYSIANRNLPHKSVSSVEVLQNHQPLKILENKIASDGTSLNIKLKNDVAVTGTLSAGAGFSPFLHDVNLTPMLFHKKQQIIATWQSNNIGDDLNLQHKPITFSMGKLDGFKNRKPELLGISSVTQPQIEKQRYLDNNANLLSYNHLLKLNNNTELKINSSFYHDQIGENGEVSTSYFLDGQTVNITEATENNYFKKSLTTDLTLTQNEKSKYITNKFSINKFWDSEEGLIQTTTNLSQLAETPHFSVANDLDILLPVKSNFLRLYSFVDYNNSPQKLSFLPGIFNDELNNGEPYLKTTQNVIAQNLVTHNFVQFSLRRKQFIFETESGVKFEDQHFKTFIEKDEVAISADSLNNQLDWKYTELYFNETIKLEKEDFIISLKIPIKTAFYNIDDKFHNAPESIKNIFVTPSLYFKYEINSFLTSRVSAKYNSQLGDVRTLAEGYVFSSYRFLKKGIDQLSEKNSFRYQVGLEYKNPISGFFSTFSWVSNRSKNNLLLKQQVSNNGFLFFDIIEKDNHSFMDNLSIKVSQYLSDWRATIDLKGFYNKNKKEYLLNDELGWSVNRVYTLQPGISVNRWKNVDLEYSFNYQLIKQESVQTNISVIEQKHKGSIFVTPIKRHLIGADFEYYKTHQTGQDNFSLFFANLSYHFKPKKGKLKFKLKVNNIFNQNEFVRFYNSDISLTKSSYQIRPRQFMATVFVGL